MEIMFLRVGFFLLGLVCLPATSAAAIINIDYTGYVISTSGNGMGYNDGDVITGSYVIDTSKAEGKFTDTPTETWYYGSLSSGFLQSNFTIPGIDGFLDFVRVINDPSLNDQVLIDKVINAYGFTMESLSVSVELGGLDWITDLSLVNLITSEGGLSTGAFLRWDLTSWTIIDSATFQFDSLSIVSIQSSVPEPAPLVLLSIAVAGLLIRRRLS
jgi:hypothetical protein